jgi:hemoglobin-like flavoprotein
MKTAVEWLVETMYKETYPFNPKYSKIFEQAKEMEKQQIEDFFNAGVRYGSGSVMSTEWGEDTEEYNFEQYYNETFKSE